MQACLLILKYITKWLRLSILYLISLDFVTMKISVIMTFPTIMMLIKIIFNSISYFTMEQLFEFHIQHSITVIWNMKISNFNFVCPLRCIKFHVEENTKRQANSRSKQVLNNSLCLRDVFWRKNRLEINTVI